MKILYMFFFVGGAEGQAFAHQRLMQGFAPP